MSGGLERETEDRGWKRGLSDKCRARRQERVWLQEGKIVCAIEVILEEGEKGRVDGE